MMRYLPEGKYSMPPPFSSTASTAACIASAQSALPSTGTPRAVASYTRVSAVNCVMPLTVNSSFIVLSSVPGAGVTAGASLTVPEPLPPPDGSGFAPPPQPENVGINTASMHASTHAAAVRF